MIYSGQMQLSNSLEGGNGEWGSKRFTIEGTLFVQMNECGILLTL